MEARPQDAVAWTDQAGQFSFSFLPAGRYQLHVFREGFQSTAFGISRYPQIETINLTAGENRADVNFQLSPLSSISGVVLDDAGDPVPDAQIQILTPAIQRRKQVFLPGPNAVTDGDGHYRISSLAAGPHVVMAMKRIPTIKGQSEVSPAQPQVPQLYGVQYYPGSPRADGAAVLNFEPGRETGPVNFRLPTGQPSATIQGTVLIPAGVNPTGGVRITLMNLDLGAPSFMGRQAFPPELVFGFDNLQQDLYVLVASATFNGKEYRGVQQVDLQGQTSQHISVLLEPGIDLSGKVKLEGPDASKYSAGFVALSPGNMLTRADGPPLRAVVGKDGSFTISNVPPGVWDINAGPIPPGGYLKSMYLGTQDVLTEEMKITSKTSSPLNIVISTQGASVQGDVKKSGDPAPRTVVLLAPDGKFRHVTSFYRYATTDEKGHYALKSIDPGKYRLYTFNEFDPSFIEDPDRFLTPSEPQSVLIELKEGQTATQNLSLPGQASGGSQ